MSHKMTSPPSSSQQRELVTGLKPPLKSALGSLTVRLEDELIRYRRSQQGETSPSAQRMLFKRDLKSLDLISIKAKVATPVAQGAPPPVPQNPRLSRSESISPTIGAISQARASGPVADLPNFEPAAPTANSLAYREPDDYLESSEALLESLATEATPQPQAVVPEPEESGSFWPSSLSTPVGMGGLLLLLVLSGGLGYALTNPAAVGQLLNHPIFNAIRPGDQNPDSTGQPYVAESGGVAGDQSDPSALGPDLASKEFFDLNLNTLSQVSVPKPPVVVPTASTPTTTTASTPTAAATQTPTPTGTTQTPTTTPDRLAIAPTPPASRPAAPAAPRPAAAPAAAPAAPRSSAPAPSRPAAAPPTRTPAPTASAPAPATSSSSGSTATPGTHYVVTDYTGDQSLSEARGVVGDAYVRNFPNGARIQLGAFDDSSSANQMVQELQNQGVPAQVYTTP